ncbi:MAG: HD domain-containing protein [Bdellovibrionales bacterium]
MDVALLSKPALVNASFDISRELVTRTKHILMKPPGDDFSRARSPRLRNLRQWLNNPSLYALAAAAYGMLIEHDIATAVHTLEVAELLTHFRQTPDIDPRLAALHYVAGMLHDVGKIAIPQATLNSTQKLTRDEKAMFLDHPAIGALLIKQTKKEIAKLTATNQHDLPSLDFVAEAALFHHVDCNGKGYPCFVPPERMTPFHYALKLWDTIHAMRLRSAYRN